MGSGGRPETTPGFARRDAEDALEDLAQRAGIRVTDRPREILERIAGLLQQLPRAADTQTLQIRGRRLAGRGLESPQQCALADTRRGSQLRDRHDTGVLRVDRKSTRLNSSH